MHSSDSPAEPGPWANGFTRRHPRIPFSVPFRIHHLKAGMSGISSGMSLDLSEGGFGALVNGKLRAGETVEIEFSVEGSDLRLIAIVRYCSSFGCGLEFLGLTPDERSQISQVTTRREMARTADLARVMG